MATAAMAGASHITTLDDGKSSYAVIIYDHSSKPVRAGLYNLDYYDGNNTRVSELFVFTGLETSSVRVKRLTATSALTRAD